MLNFLKKPVEYVFHGQARSHHHFNLDLEEAEINRSFQSQVKQFKAFLAQHPIEVLHISGVIGKRQIFVLVGIIAPSTIRYIEFQDSFCYQFNRSGYWFKVAFSHACMSREIIVHYPHAMIGNIEGLPLIRAACIEKFDQLFHKTTILRELGYIEHMLLTRNLIKYYYTILFSNIPYLINTNNPIGQLLMQHLRALLSVEELGLNQIYVRNHHYQFVILEHPKPPPPRPPKFCTKSSFAYAGSFHLSLSTLEVLRQRKQYADILGLSKPFTQAQVNSAFRRLSLRWHPDHNASAAGFHIIKEAKEQLCRQLTRQQQQAREDGLEEKLTRELIKRVIYKACHPK